MTTITLRRVLAEVRVAALETPRLYFSGVKDMTNFVGRIFARPTAMEPVKAKPRILGNSQVTARSSSLRHGKKNRQRTK